VSALKVVDDRLPVVNGGDGLVDKMRGFSVKSRVRSARSNASCSDGKRRLETRAASGVDGELEALQN
jgi:hypothetical protein